MQQRQVLKPSGSDASTTSISNEPPKGNPLRENGARKTAGLTLRDGVKVSERHRTQLRGLEMLAKKYGIAIEIAESIDAVGPDGAANGKYENGVITIALAISLRA